MTFVLNGGGGASQTEAIDRLLASELPRRTLLFIAHATAPDPWSFDRALDWMKKHEAFGDLEITSWVELEGRDYGELDDFDGIYLMGGNTFRLLSILRSSGFGDLLVKFADSKRVICGISAGAIVLGRSIATASLGDEPDENEIGLRDLSGFDLLNGYDVHAHYQESDAPELERHVGSGGEGAKVICIPEDAGLAVTASGSKVVGESSVVLHTDGRQTELPPGSILAADDPLAPQATSSED